MSNKPARRAARAGAAPSSAPTPAASMASLSSPRIRVSTGMMIGGGLLAVVASFLPWITSADGSTKPGIGTITGFGSFVLALVVVAVGVFILLRADHPRARQAAWAALVAAMGIGVMGVVAVLTVDPASGAAIAMGVLPTIAGGMIATMGIRGLLERR